MILTVVRAMWLGLWRDRGALVLAFLFPPLLFIVFAEVFSGSTGEGLELNIAMADSANSSFSQQFVDSISAIDGFVLSPLSASDSDIDIESGLSEAVRTGQADAAIWIRTEPPRYPDSDLDGEAPVLVIGDSSKALAVAVVHGRLQALIQEQFPVLNVSRAVTLVDALVGPYSDEQQQSLEELIDELELESASGESDGSINAGSLIEQRMRQSEAGIDDDGGISYYAGAVAILFLLFSAMQGAISLIDERSSGIVDRLLAGPGGARVVVIGKGVFLTLQGLVQVSIIFAVAWWLFGIDWIGKFGLWLITALLAAASAAWLAMLMASLCQTRQQAQTASAFLVLILSAVGGSMMPRFLMPGWLRDLGWLTPNAWAIEAWQGVFWRGQGAAELWLAWLVLGASALIAMCISIILSTRMSRA
ncbi:MAG: ABC transporter permease [Pseudomonadota bacterium]